jgi:hypothetical protein
MSDSVARLTPDEAALMTIFLVHRYELEKGKEVTRFRLSRNSVRLLGLRANLRDAFAEEWRDALAEWGWVAFPRGEEFGLVRSPVMDGWVRLGTKRIRDERKKLRDGDSEVLARVKKELTAAQTSVDEDDDA